MVQKVNYQDNIDKKEVIRLAVLDMYDGTPNLGMRNLMEILIVFPDIQVDSFDVRRSCEVPDLDYDIYISTGGPGSPLKGDGDWEMPYYDLIDKIWDHNQKSNDKKFVLFICHSFQMICLHLAIGDIVRRKKESFGVYPVHKTSDGKAEPLFEGLDDPFYVADFREWQVIKLNEERIVNRGFKVLALEKFRPHVKLERALMAMRFSPEWFGTQFHPEADPDGMLYHFTHTPKKAIAIEKKGKDKYSRMIELLKDPEKLVKTYDKVIPSFIENAVNKISLYKLPAKV